MVELNRANSLETPLFLIHPVSGSVFSYRDLAHNLDANLPIYGIQARGLNGEAKPATQIEEIAAYYIDLLQSVQPTGAYQLCGWSLGGVIAFEMAQQLYRRGEKVSKLVMIDTFAPTLTDISLEVDETNLMANFALNLGGVAGKDFSISIAQLESLDSEERLQYLLARAKADKILPSEVGSNQIRHRWEVYRALSRAIDYYLPQPYSSQIIFFFANDSIESSRDSQLGWSSLTAKNAIVHHIPGNHYSILQSKVLAQKLRAELRSCS